MNLTEKNLEIIFEQCRAKGNEMYDPHKPTYVTVPEVCNRGQQSFIAFMIGFHKEKIKDFFSQIDNKSGDNRLFWSDIKRTEAGNWTRFNKMKEKLLLLGLAAGVVSLNGHTKNWRKNPQEHPVAMLKNE